jgi:hypothetical protein
MATKNILHQLDNAVTDELGDGILVSRPVLLSEIEAGTNVALAADETNARVLEVTNANDTVGYLTFPIPRDYDETQDELKVRVLASMVTVSTDDDVELDSELYVKTAGSALGSDLDPTAPGVVLSATEQWIEFDLSGNGLSKDDVANFVLITNGANDTSGEEVLIHAIELLYRSTLVAYSYEDRS